MRPVASDSEAALIGSRMTSDDLPHQVASDMDCLLLGSKNARYTPMEPNQIVQIEWMLDRIEEVSTSECV